ncbi:MAG TPA: hypothetical protein VGI39_24570 [Polyangiaceae bacterium]|jgi:hypothetical protein
MNHRTSERAPSAGLVRDERGAIMVMGIFMCAILAGALWYVAGIGDAIVFRERMQEAADSVTFSGAIIDARGMNIIVLINLLMASILAIRVAIRVIMVLCAIMEAVMYAIGAALNVFGGEFFVALGDGFDAGRRAMKAADDATYDAINDALKALNVAWNGVAKLTPAASYLGALEMNGKYKPPVGDVPPVPVGAISSLGSGGTLFLPVQDGTLDDLCHRSIDALDSVFKDIAGDTLGGLLGGMFKGVADVDPMYFCGFSNGPPDTSKIGNSACSQAAGKACDQLQQAQQQLDKDKAADAGASVIDHDQSQVDALNKQCNNAGDPNSDEGQSCNSSSQSGKGKNGGSADASGHSASTSDDMTPAALDPNAYPDNGCMQAQQVYVVRSDGDPATLRVSPRGVAIAGFGKGKATGTLNEVQKLGWAQAEYFYDDSGAWAGLNPDAMWNFYWRARFRLFNPNSTGGEIITLAQVPYGVIFTEAGVSTVAAGNAGTLQSLPLKLKLGEAITHLPDPFILH